MLIYIYTHPQIHDFDKIQVPGYMNALLQSLYHSVPLLRLGVFQIMGMVCSVDMEVSINWGTPIAG